MAYETGFKTTLALKLNIADTTMTVATAPTITAGRVFLDNGAQQERITFTGVTGKILTGLVRGLSTTGDPAVAGTGKARIAGTQLKIVAMHDQMLDKQLAQTIGAPRTFTNLVTRLGNLAGLDLTGAKKGFTLPSLTTVERLALTPVNGMHVYDSTLGMEYMYKAGTRASVDTGTSTGNATSSATGSMQLSKVATGIDVGSTGGPLAVMPSELIALYDNTYMLGENVTAGQCLFLESGPTTGVATTKQNIGDVAGNTRISFPVIGTGVGSTTFKVNLCKTASPTVNLNFRIETDNAGSPSGTLVDTNATGAVTAASLTTSLADTTVTLSGAGVANAHGVTLDSTEASQTLYKGIKFTLTSQTGIITVTKDSDCSATTAYLYDTSNTLLATAVFSSQTATFNYNGLTSGQSYYLMCGSGGSAYVSVKQTGSASYPYNSTQLNYVGGIANTLAGYIDEAHNISLNFGTAPSNTAAFGVKILAKYDLILTEVTTAGSSAYLYDGVGTLLSTKTVTAGKADFGGYSLIAGRNYYITADYGGGAYTARWTNRTTSATKANIDYVDAGGAGFGNVTAIKTSQIAFTNNTTEVNNITAIEAGTQTQLALGTKYHVVAFQGTYGSETVSGTNYYNIGYSTNKTTTRPFLVYTGTIWTQSGVVNSGGMVADVIGTGWTSTDNPTSWTQTFVVGGSNVRLTKINMYNYGSYPSNLNITGMGVNVDSYGGVFGSSPGTFNVILISGQTYTITATKDGSNFYTAGNYYTTGQTTTNIASYGTPSNSKGLVTSIETNTVTGSDAMVFPYISSTMVQDKLLSLTDADYAYKIDLYGISTENKGIGTYPKLTTQGVNANQSSLVAGYQYYISGTPGALNAGAGTVTKTIGVAISSTKIRLFDYNGSDGLVTASDVLQASSDAVKSINETSMTKKKSITTYKGGTLRIFFELQRTTASNATTGQIYKNGSALGTARTISTTTNVRTAYTEDLVFAKGDTIELRASANSSSGELKNFRVSYSENIYLKPLATLN